MQQNEIVHEPFWLGPEDAEQACLLIHGFMGSPREMFAVGQRLAAHNIRVYGMLVAGHEGDTEYFLRVGHKAWLASAEKAFAQLSSYKHVFVVGFSMGSALALLLACRYPEQVAGLVALAPLVRVQAHGWQAAALPLLPLARHFVGWFYPLQALNFQDPGVQERVLEQARLRDPNVVIDFADREVVAFLKKQVRIPIPAIDELVHLARAERRQFRKLRTPLQIIHGRLDQTASPEGAEELYRRTILALPRSLHWLEQSDHMLVTGPELGEIERLIPGFMRECVEKREVRGR